MGRPEVAKQSKSQIQVRPHCWAAMGFPGCLGPRSASPSLVGSRQGRGLQAALGQGRWGMGRTPDPHRRRQRDGVRGLGTALWPWEIHFPALCFLVSSSLTGGGGQSH